MNMYEKILENMTTKLSPDREIPIDGDLYSMNSYLQEASKGGSSQFFRLYLNHLQYFIGIYDLKGDNEFNRIAPALIRHCLEFGKVALTKFNGKLLPLAISQLEYDIYGNITKCKGIPVRVGYGYTKDLKTIECKPDEVAILKHDYLALPLLYYWREPLETIIKLLQAAITGSIASIKKFKRNIQNNSSTISKIEELSFIDPTTPYISVIANPTGYAGINRRVANSKESVLRETYDIDTTTAPSSVEFSTVNPDTSYLWENLKEYMEFIYYQLNRRLNTNKKNERNIAAEIQTETINFDLLDQEFKRYLLLFVDECKEKLNIDIELKDFIVDSIPDNEETYDNHEVDREKVYEVPNNQMN